MSALTLSDFQQQFSDNILSSDINEQFLNQIKQSSQAQKRFSIYRNNVLHSLSEALGDTYPITKRLLGDVLFKQIAIDFVRGNPPTQPSLSFYGGSFSDFIKTHELCRTLPYLTDIASLEWHYQQAFHAQDQQPLTIAELQTVSADQLENICLTPLPSVHLLASPFPIDVIWEENLKPEVSTINLSLHSACYLLVYRPVLDVKIIALEKQCFEFLTHLCQGKPISLAWQATHAPINELGAQLAYLLNLQIFSNYYLANEEE